MNGAAEAKSVDGGVSDNAGFCAGRACPGKNGFASTLTPRPVVASHEAIAATVFVAEGGDHDFAFGFMRAKRAK